MVGVSFSPGIPPEFVAMVCFQQNVPDVPDGDARCIFCGILVKRVQDVLISHLYSICSNLPEQPIFHDYLLSKIAASMDGARSALYNIEMFHKTPLGVARLFTENGQRQDDHLVTRTDGRYQYTKNSKTEPRNLRRRHS